MSTIRNSAREAVEITRDVAAGVGRGILSGARSGITTFGERGLDGAQKESVDGRGTVGFLREAGALVEDVVEGAVKGGVAGARSGVETFTNRGIAQVTSLPLPADDYAGSARGRDLDL